ncbi:MAG: hypothetical protein K0Q64_1398 [Nitrobacter vulgaris]|nr:hypothetical protein [Nitrobacter vulgaris]
MTPELASICEQYGVTVVHPAQHRPFVPMHTAAGATLDKILIHEGEDHLRDVLTVLTESENNKNMLIAPVIKAVSRIMAKNPKWYRSDASKFLEVMDKADLPSIYMRARANKTVLKAHETIAALLLD